MADPAPLHAHMPEPTENPFKSAAAPAEATYPPHEHHPLRNFLVLVLYQIVMRIGWIFKTESIVIPAVLDYITPEGAMKGRLRGLLPLLSRFGLSIPPLLFARRLKITRRKKLALAGCTGVMAATFLALAVCFHEQNGASATWLPWLFLALYAVFFVAHGLNMLSLNTLQGKLVTATRRGRLLMLANTIGAVLAVIAAFVLLNRWLGEGVARFDLIFGFTGVCFAISAACGLLLAETPDDFREQRRGVPHIVQSALSTVRHDRVFRRLSLVAAAFGSSLILFPHYQAYGREQLGMTLKSLLLLVCVQNAGTAVVSLIVGPVADAHGNRRVLTLVLGGVLAMPLAAVLFGLLRAADWYWIVFVFVGLTPVTFKTLQNYTLEIAPAAEHPRYLSTLNLSFAAPILFSPLVGSMVDWFGFEPVFLIVSIVLAAGWLLSFTLPEPRDAATAAETPVEPYNGA